MKLRRKIAVFLACLGIASSAAIWTASLLVERAAKGCVFAQAGSVPNQKVALVLGCSPTLRSGSPNPFFEGRIDAAAALWKAGKVQHLLVSGDNHSVSYDEPTRMKESLVARGVPESVITLDYAGFSTFDSVIRARKVFGVESLCVVTQPDHAKRALYIARRVGVKAVAFKARDVSLQYSVRAGIREALARVRTVLDVDFNLREPHFLGPQVQIASQ